MVLVLEVVRPALLVLGELVLLVFLLLRLVMGWIMIVMELLMRV
jgi:hypothetical protein